MDEATAVTLCRVPRKL